MSYIILNGVDSRTINGLLIQSLPPISKPMKRTSIEEIDGRDGDIVSVLGYSAYDVTVKIGLHGDFDLDQIMSFFNSEGNAIFSDRPDRYFHYVIYDKTDFERLIRFRQADVTFHVQPFLYKNEEPVVLTADGTVTNHGTVKSKPIYTITGTGNVGITVNGSLVLQIDFGDDPSIVINTQTLDASYNGVLKNRSCNGDYANMQLPVGENTIAFTGDVTSCEIVEYSRWL